MSAERKFPSPFEIETPSGASGWEEMYPYYTLFSEDRDSKDRFWFCDTMHHPIPLFPFDAITAEAWGPALGQYNSRIFLVPPALGIDQRILNGYLYISPIPVDSPNKIKERIKEFTERAGFYYKNWNRLYTKWKRKVKREIENIKKIEIPALEEKESFNIVKEAVGISSGYRLIEAYNRIIESMYKIWQYHFEFLNLGYVAFLDFSNFMKEKFPDIADSTITKLVAGIDVLLFKPDMEIRRLSKLADDLNLTNIFLELKEQDKIITKLKESEGGRKWLSELEMAKEPWFYFNAGTGFYHNPRSWIDDLSIPFSAILGYIKKIKKGEAIEIDKEKIRKEAKRLKNGYFELLKKDEDKRLFLEKINLAKRVFPYVEEHNFFVEHWHFTIFWNKIREIGRLFQEKGFFSDGDDIFYLNRYEVGEALYELYYCWAVGSSPRAPLYWKDIIKKRRGIIKALEKWQPTPALGIPPENITEPFTIMLWGIVSEKIDSWLEFTGKSQALIKGYPASPGIVEGIARIILTSDELSKIQEGEIMVCPITTPSWTPIFAKIKGVVTNVGGMMSHAAIVCREYGLPAVVGTGFGTQLIKTGQKIKVNGNKGIVEIV
ncbi:MAG: PEP-utilizing enzyme [bacterium]